MSGEPLPPALIDIGYSLDDLIGGGHFSTVHKAKNSNKPNKVMVCKRIYVEKAPKVWKDNCMRLELKILRRVVHPSIVKVHELFKTRKTIYIFTEYCSGESIHKLLQKERKPFPECLAKRWFAQILGALSYCHSKGVAHRDINLANFLLTEDWEALLTDFDFSVQASSRSDDILRKTFCGHPAYMAPEVFRTVNAWPYEARAADMYSMGVCLFEMLNYDKPYDASHALNNEGAYVLKQKNREYRFHEKVDKVLSKEIKDLIYRLLDPKGGSRITAQQTLIHKGIMPSVD